MRRALGAIARFGVVLFMLVGIAWAGNLERLVYTVDHPETLKWLERHIDSIDVIAPQVFAFTPEGVVYGEIDKRIVALAKKHQKRLMPLVVNENFNKEGVKAFLANPKAQERFIETLLSLARSEGYWGWQLDLEHLGIASAESYTRLVRKLHVALRGRGIKLSIAVVPPRGEGIVSAFGAKVFEDWIAPYDLRELARHSDFLSLMAYDQHTGGSTPGPIASKIWVESLLKEALKHAPKEKISLGIPLYSRLWYAGVKEGKPRSTARAMSYASAQDWLARQGIESQWLEREGVAWARGERGGNWEYLFIEEARSFREKVDLARRYELRGVSLWRLGQEDQGIWEGF